MAVARLGVRRLPTWAAAVIPLALIALLIGLFIWLDPIARLRAVPPVEAIAVERTVFEEGRVTLSIRNDGPDPVTIAQVLVDEAYWNYSITDQTLGRLETARITLDYPWDPGLPLSFSMITSTGLVIEHEVEAAALTPPFDARSLGVFALLGLYIGVVPVGLGLLWFPALRQASRKWLGFFLAFTVGLLVFLLIDTIAEGFELAAATAATLDGLAVFVMGALGAVLGLVYLGGALARRSEEGVRGLFLAYLIAAGIGLHNLGEGLAVGAAVAAGEVALGTFLVLGFAVHNTTEGLAIVAPLGSLRSRPSLWHFVGLGALAGVPTIFGAWAGGFAFAPVWGALAFGLAAGAIAQVVWTIGKALPAEGNLATAYGTLGFLAGLAVMYATSLYTV
ncbi:MAG: ZIP family metal transporter [Actinomycetota bacterium]